MSEGRRAAARAARAGERPWDPSDGVLVRWVGRLPTTVRTKLLIGFVGTAVVVVAVGLLGLRVLGQSNDRIGRLGVLQERALAYGKLESDTRHIRLLLVENPGPDFFEVNPGVVLVGRERSAAAIDMAVANALVRIAPETSTERLGFAPPPAHRRFPRGGDPQGTRSPSGAPGDRDVLAFVLEGARG